MEMRRWRFWALWLRVGAMRLWESEERIWESESLRFRGLISLEVCEERWVSGEGGNGGSRGLFWTPEVRKNEDRLSNPGDRRRIFPMHAWITPPPPPHSPRRRQDLSAYSRGSAIRSASISKTDSQAPPGGSEPSSLLSPPPPPAL